MIAEDKEFQISQYADGTLPAAERSSVDDLLKADPEARKLLAEYQNLDGQLAQLRGLPELKWDRLADHISNSIADEGEAPAVAGRIGWALWSGRLRIAAAVLITTTVGVVVYHSFHRETVQPVAAPASVSDVSGPSAEVAVGKPSEDISVGPSALAQREAASHNVDTAIVPGRSKVIINEAIANPTKDKLHPH